ncbi:MAG TPA: DUF3352 domain-containing protein [Blastocatellia bacterium]|nr:DUF3352 domain-containing protein [Blastocatellia bacterium]
MKISRRGVILIIILAVAVAGAAIAYRYWPQRPKTEMSIYVPASSMLYLEITDVPNLLNGFTSTIAWQKLAPVLGISSQLNYLGNVGSFAAATGMGSQEAVVLARSQVAVALTAIEANGDEVKPQFAVIVKTHSDKSQVAAIADRRVASLARYAYGPDAQKSSSEYGGVQVATYTKPGTGRQIVYAVVDDLILLGNNTTSIYSCIDTALQRAPSLSENADLQKTRQSLGHDAIIFAFVSSSGVSRLTQFGAYVFSQGHIVPEDLSDSVNTITGDVASGTLGGIGYSASFDNGVVVDRYLLALKPDVSARLSNQLKPVKSDLQVLKIAPPGVNLTVVNIDQPPQAFETLMATVSSHVNVATSIALRQLVLFVGNNRFGLNPDQPIGPALGNEIALLGWPGDEEPAIAIEVTDQAAIAPVLHRYLQGNPKHPAFVDDQHYNGIEFFTGEDRAGAFLGRFAILGSKEQLMRLIDAWKANSNLSNNAVVRNEIQSRPSQAIMESYEPNQAETADLMLKISSLLRVSDGNPEVLNRPEVHNAVQETPSLVSYTTITEPGIYTETRSALGRFTLLSTLTGKSEEVLDTKPAASPQTK